MSETIKFQCHIKISGKKLNELTGKTLTLMGNSKTIDENGEVVFDCELQERDKHKSFPITLEGEEYSIVGTGQCNAIAHRTKDNTFCLILNKDDEASIKHIRIYKEQDKPNSNEKEQIDIYTTQVEKREDTTTQQTSADDTNTSQTPLQENQNLIALEAHLTSGKALKKDIQWAYYVKYKNEPLWEKSKIKKENLEPLTFTSKAKHNTQVSFDINAKFQYTIKEDETQKEVEDYLKEKQQLVLFAYKNNPAYETSNGQTHTILTINALPIIGITYNTLTLLHKNTQQSFQINNSIMSHLIKDFKEDKQYELGYNKTEDYITLKSESNKLYKMYKDTSNNIAQSSLGNTQESNPTQNNQNPNNTQTSNTQQTNTDSLFLKASKDFEELQTLLELRKQQNYQSMQVWVEVGKPYYIDDEGYLHWEANGEDKIKRAKEIWQKVKHADQTKQLATALEKGNLTKQQIKAIVLHRTDTDTSLQAINGFLRGVGTHFLIDTDGTIYQCASLYKYTQHIGKIGSKCYDNDTCDESYTKKILGYYQGKIPKQIHDNVRKEEEKNFAYPNRYPINNESIGIEVVGKATDLRKLPIDNKYPQITFYAATWDTSEQTDQTQKDSIKNLVEILKTEYNLTENDIYEHDDISPQKTRGEAKDLYEKE